MLFLVGAVLLLFEDDDDDDDDDDDEPNIGETPRTRWSVVATSFGVVVLSEFADPSRLVVATLAARHNDPLAVGIGSLLGLWAVSALAVHGAIARSAWCAG